MESLKPQNVEHDRRKERLTSRARHPRASELVQSLKRIMRRAVKK